MQIGVAIPFYGQLDYLRRAIRSVIDQDSPEWRLWVSADGPVDGFEQLEREFGDSRIQFHQSPSRLGMVGNWNRCLELADTPWVTLLHGDDWFLPNYVSTFLKAVASFPDAAALFCTPRVVDASGRPCFSFPDYYKKLIQPRHTAQLVLRGEAALKRLARGNFIFCPTLCYRKAALPLGGFSSRWQQVPDLDLTSTLILSGETLVGLKETAYAYRRHPASTTEVHTRTLERFQEELRLLSEIASRAEEKGWKQAAKTARASRIVFLNLGYRTLLDLWHRHWADAGRKMRFFRDHWSRSSA